MIHLFTSLLAVLLAAAPLKTELSLPAYPLVTIDPNTSAWSMTDALYDSPVRHWTGKDFPLLGAVAVDGVIYRFMGKIAPEQRIVAPLSGEGTWTGRYTFDTPADDWFQPGFDDKAWPLAEGAFGLAEPEVKTLWKTPYIWVRREVWLGKSLKGKSVILEFSNDDDAVFYVNGTEVFSTNRCHKYRQVVLPPEVVATLKAGRNIIAAKCWNRRGNALLDVGLKEEVQARMPLDRSAEQLGVEVHAMNTIYTFRCGKADLRVTFTAPMFLDRLDLLSRPVNYISYDVSSNDGRPHDIRLYVEASPRWAVDIAHQQTESFMERKDGLLVLRAGTLSQEILAKKGDDRRIDWGYFYLAAEEGQTVASLGAGNTLRQAFAKGKFAPGPDHAGNGQGQMGLIRSHGRVTRAQGKFLIGYDDIRSIQFFGTNLRPWWNRRGDKTMQDMLLAALKEYPALMEEAAAFDASLWAECAAAGGKQYADLCSAAYRQAIAAHKLVQAPNGDILWLSKENNSNGSIGTVDVTYPSAPLFLRYNPDLVKGLLNHIFYYTESGLWGKPFAAHDVGTYPIANGQTYGGDMPVEECGNMVILAAAIAVVEGNADYAAHHWNALSRWTDYLVQNGQDPANQLCTDDFAGHLAHNANLSVKAIEGVAAYARLAEMRGLTDIARTYRAKALEMAAAWKKEAFDGDHYRLTFDRPGTWSQKYNLVWDKVLGLNVFDPDIVETEIPYYLTRQNRYGLPLDCRRGYTKTDWVIWTATMSPDRETFGKFIAPLYDYFDQTDVRVPMSDWIQTENKGIAGFKARSVVGGYFIKAFSDYLASRSHE